jgi:DNA replication protein DnaC
MINSELASRLSQIGQVVGTQTRHCDVHGPYTSMQRRVLGGGLVWSGCEKCLAIRDQQIADEQKRTDLEARKKNQLEQKHRHLSNLGISPRFYDVSLDSYIPRNSNQSQVKQVFERLTVLREQSEQDRNLDRCFILFGDVDVGKTHLLTSLVKEMEGPTLKTRYTTALRMIKDLRSVFGNNSQKSEQSMLDKYVKPDLLAIDEVGLQFGTEAERIIFYEVINYRYESMKMTVLGTNLGRESLTELLGARVMRRLLGNGAFIGLDGDTK